MIKERINEITCLNRQIQGMQARKAELLIPAIADYALLRQLLDVFILQEGVTGVMTKWQQREYFFVALWFCSPAALVNGRMRRGVRGTASKLLGCSPSQLSKYIPELTFLYLNYPDFKNTVDTIVRIVDRIIKGG